MPEQTNHDKTQDHGAHGRQQCEAMYLGRANMRCMYDAGHDGDHLHDDGIATKYRWNAQGGGGYHYCNFPGCDGDGRYGGPGRGMHSRECLEDQGWYRCSTCNGVGLEHREAGTRG